MTKRERLMRAIRGEKPDRVPVSIYQHSTVHNRGAREFADFTLEFHKKFDPDYVKVMCDELYDTPVNYQFATDSSVWALLETLNPHKGAFGRYLESLRRIRDAIDADTPVVATVFAPFHIAVRLAWKRLIEDVETQENLVIQGLRAISATTSAFVQAAMNEVGVDGFFLGAFGCESEWLSESTYMKVVAPFDREVLTTMKDASFTILHIHGENGSYFDSLSSYPCDALSWEDRLGGPSLKTARTKTGKCLVGGVDHVAARTASSESVYAQARDAISITGSSGFILAPGCTFLAGTPDENMLALKRASEDAAAEKTGFAANEARAGGTGNGKPPSTGAKP
jgi:uroporphyrinogen decarboxylase